jgi:hypothetical protein
VTRLRVKPPFSKREWANTKVRDLAEGNMGPRLTEYLVRYTEAVLRQGGDAVDELLEKAGLPVRSRARFSVPELRRVLSRLATLGGGYGVEFLEQLLAVNQFMEFLVAHDRVRLDRATKNWAERCHELALVALVVCVNRHFGFLPDDGGGEQ